MNTNGSNSDVLFVFLYIRTKLLIFTPLIITEVDFSQQSFYRQ